LFYFDTAKSHMCIKMKHLFRLPCGKIGRHFSKKTQRLFCVATGARQVNPLAHRGEASPWADDVIIQPSFARAYHLLSRFVLMLFALARHHYSGWWRSLFLG
jgi:hypothetical protein